MAFVKDTQCCFISIITFLIIILSQVTFMSCANCQNVTVFDGDNIVTDSVCTGVYLTEDCKDFAQTKDVNFLPEDLQGRSVQPPGDFLVTPHLWEHKQNSFVNYFPGLSFQWISPFTGTARQNIKGFFITIQAADQEQTLCRIVSIDHSNYINKRLKFHLDIPRVSQAKNRVYTVRIYSLPLNYTYELETKENYRSMMVSTKDPFQKRTHRYPADWTPEMISIKTDPTGTVDVYFSLPENKTYNFTEYKVNLVNLIDDPFTNFQINPVHIPPSSSDTTAHVQFSNLPMNDVYKVVVYAEDIPSNDEKKCLCWEMEEVFGNLMKVCASYCARASSFMFDMQGTVHTKIPSTPLPPLTSTPAPTPSPSLTSTPSSTLSSTLTAEVGQVKGKGGDSSSKNVELIAGVTVSLACAFIIAFMCVFIQRKRRTGYFCKSPRQRDGSIPVVQPVVPQPPSPSLPQRTIYLMSSRDHKYHKMMTEKFAHFLKIHCRCDVIEPSELDCEKHPGGCASWLSDKLNKCHSIIFVDSFGAHRRFVAFDEQKLYRPVDMGPDGDLFNLGLQHIYKDLIPNNMGSQLLIVSFAEESSKKKPFMPKEFQLPKYFSPFLQRLHNFGPSSIDTYSTQLPLIPAYLHKLPQYIDLMSAVGNAINFERQNPDWFSSHFELETPPKVERILSIHSNQDSDYGSGPRSVTPTMGNSNNSSPFSELVNHLEFPIDNEDDQSYCNTILTDMNLSTAQSGIKYINETEPGIEPPQHRFQLWDGNVSEALRDLNRNGNGNNQWHEAKTKSNDRYIGRSSWDDNIVPPGKLPDSHEADQFSSIMRNLNTQNSRDYSSPVKTNDNMCLGNPRDNKIIPPGKLPVSHNTDNFSSVMRNMNAENSSSSNYQRSGSSQDDKIVPPRKLPNSHNADSFSTVMRGMNAQNSYDNSSPFSRTDDVTPPGRTRTTGNGIIPPSNPRTGELEMVDNISTVMRNMNSASKDMFNQSQNTEVPNVKEEGDHRKREDAQNTVTFPYAVTTAIA